MASWYEISQAIKNGQPFMVKTSRLYSGIRKLEEVYDNLERGKGTMSAGQLPEVTKFGAVRGGFFILDGHHRILEQVKNGATEILVTMSEHIPYIDQPYGGFIEMYENSMDVDSFVKTQRQRSSVGRAVDL